MTQTITEEETIELISVSEALRKHFGRMRVRGTITSLTKLFKMIVGVKSYCDKCNKLNEVYFPEPVFTIKYEDRKCTNSDCQKLINNVNYDYCNAVIVELQD